MRLQLVSAVLVMILALLGGCAPSGPQWPEFHNLESLGSLPKWSRVVRAEAANPSFTEAGLAGLDPERNARWLELCESLADQPLQRKLAVVNRFFNQWPYLDDAQVWRQADYWATPAEFAAHSGNCEDFAITKYYALRFLGVPAESMRIAGVWNKRRGEGHAVLLVLPVLEDGSMRQRPAGQYGSASSVGSGGGLSFRVSVSTSRDYSAGRGSRLPESGGTAYLPAYETAGEFSRFQEAVVLDNFYEQPLPAEELTHYTPVYYANENGLWTR